MFTNRKTVLLFAETGHRSLFTDEFRHLSGDIIIDKKNTKKRKTPNFSLYKDRLIIGNHFNANVFLNFF